MHAVAPNVAWPYPCWIAHRGAGELAPENTMAAFRLGAEHGFAMFECDVKLSADGEPFLLHDTELDRTTNGRGEAGLQTWDALSRLDAGSWHGRPYAGEPLLRLEALARWLQALGMMVNLEIKPTPGDEVRTGRVVAQHVARLWSLAHVKPLLSSFSTVALEAARPAVRTPAGLHQHPQRRPGLQRPDERPAREALALDDPALRIGEGQLEDLFCQIDGDGTSMHGVDSSRDPVS